MDFGKLETAFVDRLQAVPGLSHVKIEAWPNGADMEGVVISDFSMFVRFGSLSMQPQQSRNRVSLRQEGTVSVELHWLCESLRGHGAYSVLPLAQKAISCWPSPDERIIDSPLHIAPMGFQLASYELIDASPETGWLWRWGAEYVADITLLNS